MMPLIIACFIAYVVLGAITSSLSYGICNNPEVRRFIIDKPPICILIWPLFLLFITIYLIKFLCLYVFESIKEIIFIAKELFKSLGVPK